MDKNKLKYCPRCKQNLPKSEFHRNSFKKDGLSDNCKKCNIKYSMEWKNKNPNKVRKHRRKKKYVRNYYRKNKLKLIEFMGGECVMCNLKPEDVDGCLGVFVVDEIEPLGRKRKFNNLSKKDLELAKKLFLDGKTQLLCQNCSAIKSWENGDYSNGVHG